MHLLRCVPLLAVTVSTHLISAATLDLAGTWRVHFDDQAHEIRLPGSLPGHGLGDPITVDTPWTGGVFDRAYYDSPAYAPYREPGNIKVPFWLQPETYFVGVARYERTIEIPRNWAGRRLVLTLERPHWKTTVFIDGREIGSSDAMSVPHVYDLGTALAPGSHTLRIDVDNTHEPDIGENSHSISDHTQGNWNGIVGRIELTATAPVWIDDVRITPDVAARAIEVRGQLARASGEAFPPEVRLEVGEVRAQAPVAADGSFSTRLVLGRGTGLWDEFTPNVHTLRASLANGEVREVAFGLRTIGATGRQLTINGRPLFLRGTLDCAAYPRTGHPPMDVESWRRVFSVIKAHGLNHVRYHSWCPPEAAFVAADELGVYLQVEAASWPNQSTTLGDGKPVDAWINAETERILRAYGNHPSFVILAAGNEPGGRNHAAWLSDWLERQKAADPRRLYTAAAGWPEVPENDFHIRSEPRIQQWGQGLGSRINARPPETRTDYGDFIRARQVPVVAHEIGQWCVFPNFAEMPKYTGYLKPRNFEIFRDRLEAHGLGHQAHEFLLASGKLQALCYKEDIESALRTPEMGGFQLLSLSDFPGQGTALVGILDAFWEEKGYITPAEFRRFCQPTVPLARLDRRVFTANEHLIAQVDLAHYGAAELEDFSASWKLVDAAGHPVAQGKLQSPDRVPLGLSTLGRLDLPLDALATPARYTLVVSVNPAAGTGDSGSTSPTAENGWDIWVYPAAEHVRVTAPPEVTLTTTFDETAAARLRDGGTVVLLIPPDRVAPDPQRGPIALGFSSIFWNTAWTNGQAPHTLGILCDPKHPALAQFPTESHSNWQWWYPLHDAAPMLLAHLPRELQPIVQVIDDWFTSRKLGLVFEARVHRGRLLVTSIDLNAAVLDPVRRQLRASLLAYAASPQFQPDVAVTPEQVRALFRSR